MVIKIQAGLLAQGSSFSKPSRLPSGIYGELNFHSGGTAWDFNPLSFSTVQALVKNA
jgi:hypothetical protein